MRSDTSEPRLVTKRQIDQTTGVASTTYYWDGRLVPKIEVTGTLVEQLSGWSMIAKDLDSSLKWFRQAEAIANKHRSPNGKGYFHMPAREDFDTVKGLFVASLTFYGKCFTESSGRHAQLSRSALDVNFREIHDDFMRYRHNFAAHSGDEQLEIAKTYVLISADRKEFVPVLPTARMQPDLLLPDQGEIGFGELIEHARTKVAEKYDNVARKVINELVVPAGVEFWSAAADKGEPIELATPPKSKS